MLPNRATHHKSESCCHWHLLAKLLKSTFMTYLPKCIQPCFTFSAKFICYICQTKFSRPSLYIFRIIQWLIQFYVLVVRRYVFIFLRVEQKRSLTVFVLGPSNSKLIKSVTSDNRTFCGCANLRSRLMMNVTSVLVLRSSKSALSNDSCVSELFLFRSSP